MMAYVLIIVLATAVGCLWYFVKHSGKSSPFTKGRKHKQVQSTVSSSHNGHKPENPSEYIDNLVAVPARIYDNNTRTVATNMLPAAAVRQIRKDYGNLGRRWERDGQWIYSVVRLVDGKYVPTQRYMTLSLNNPPERLHRALQQQETETFYKPRDNRGLLSKYGHYLLFAGVVIAILFLWGANMMRS